MDPLQQTIDILGEAIDQVDSLERRERSSFVEFLETDARVKNTQTGETEKFTFEGREPLREVALEIDRLLGNDPEELHGQPGLTGERVKDACLYLVGGSQVGKSILFQMLVDYVAAILFQNIVYYIPSDRDLKTFVDAKVRTENLDIMGHLFGPLKKQFEETQKEQVFKSRSIDNKQILKISDGNRTALALFQALNKIQTMYSVVVSIIDEVDDTDQQNIASTEGRSGASDTGIIIYSGAARIKDGGIEKLAGENSSCGRVLFLDEKINIEDTFPECFRYAIGDDGQPRTDDPQLNSLGTFHRPGEPDNILLDHTAPLDGERLYIASPTTGQPIDRRDYTVEHLYPERRQNNPGFRIVPACLSGYHPERILDRYRRALRDPFKMLLFWCEVMGKPLATAQHLTRQILDKAVSSGNILGTAEKGPHSRHAGLDIGELCHLTAYDSVDPATAPLTWAEKIPLGQAVRTVVTRARQMAFDTLIIDFGPEKDIARQIVWELNNMKPFPPISVRPEAGTYCITFSANHHQKRAQWFGNQQQWRDTTAAVCGFWQHGANQQTKHTYHQTVEGHPVPTLQAVRDAILDLTVKQILTPEEGHFHTLENGTVREKSRFRFPPFVGELMLSLRDQLITGSETEKTPTGERRYKRGGDDHFLLSLAYAYLGEICLWPHHQAASGVSAAQNPQVASTRELNELTYSIARAHQRSFMGGRSARFGTTFHKN